MPVDPTVSERLTALELERRRRGLRNLDELDRATTWTEREEIIAAYAARKQEQAAEKAARIAERQKRCRSCAHWDGGICAFGPPWRPRRKDADGVCLEYTQEKRRRRWVDG